MSRARTSIVCLNSAHLDFSQIRARAELMTSTKIRAGLGSPRRISY